jgi:hypothetical protein
MKKKIVIRNSIIFLIVIVLGIALYAVLNTTKLIIANRTPYSLEDAKVYASGELIWEGNLPPGQEVVIRFIVDFEGTFRIEGYMDNGYLNFESVGYITPGNYLTDHLVQIQGREDLIYSIF